MAESNADAPTRADELTASEKRMRDAVRSAMRAYLDAVRRAVLGDTVQSDAHPSDLPPNMDSWPPGTTWSDKVDSWVIPAAGKVWRDGYWDTLKGHSRDNAELDDADYVDEYLRDTKERMTGAGWPDEVYEAVREQVITSRDQHETQQQLRERIADTLDVDNWSARSDAVARSEHLAGLNAGHYKGAQRREQVFGEKLWKQWSAVEDSRTRPDHASADGQIVAMDDEFDIGGEGLRYPHDNRSSAENSVNCFPGDTRVDFPALRAVMRRWYEGDLVHVRLASGNEFSCTPNHPILRSSGRWQPAGELHEGDDLVQARFGRHSVGAPDEDGRPAKISELYRAAEIAAGSERVGVSPRDFHGDGSDGEVEVVPIHGELSVHGEPASDHEVEQLGLALADVVRSPVGVGSCRVGSGDSAIAEPSAELVHRVGASSGCVRGSGEGSALLGSGLLKADGVGLSSSARLDPSISETALDGVPSDPVLHGQGLHAHSGVEVSSDGGRIHGDPFAPSAVALADINAALAQDSADPVGSDMQPPSERLDAFASEVALDHVISIERFGFRGHVYNLDTGYGVYSANNISVRNCRCTLLYLDSSEVPDDIRGAAMTSTTQADADAAPGSWCERVANAVPTEPPAAWFGNPELTGPTKIRVTDEGRVFGHVAGWDVEHAAEPGVTANLFRGEGYHRFHRHPIRTADGTRMKTGPLSTGGHADDVTVTAAQAHYDDPTFVAADVTAGEDAHGIWVSGALRPGVSPFQVQILDRYSISGDWRDGELVAACAVSAPGFHLDHDDSVVALSASASGEHRSRLGESRPRARRDDDGYLRSLTAAGVVTEREPATQPPFDGWRMYREFKKAEAADARVTQARRRLSLPRVLSAAARVRKES